MSNPLPNILKATIQMALCNNAINRNRNRTEAELTEKLQKTLGNWMFQDRPLLEIDDFIGTLTEDEVLMLVDGEEKEAIELLVQAGLLGPDVLDLMVDIFEQVL